jgi:CHAD domain-containing protein
VLPPNYTAKGQREGTMPHRIGKHEDIGRALLRLAAEDLSAAQRALDEGKPSDRTIHRVRQRLKRARSVLRVLKPALGDKAKLASGSLRAAGRLLSRARDADVAAESARELTTTAHGEEVGFGRVVVLLDREAKANQPPSIGRVIELIAASEQEIAGASDDFDGDALLSRAIKGAYKRGVRARARAEETLTTPDLHQWRKAVKDLWHLLKLSRKRLPRRGSKVVPDYERLSELLGLDHDHAVLAEKLAVQPTGDPALMAQLALIAQRRRALEAEAFELGAKLYRKRPRAFRERVALG